jgi:flagellar P-ring protein precursor FlgI
VQARIGRVGGCVLLLVLMLLFPPLGWAEAPELVAEIEAAPVRAEVTSPVVRIKDIARVQGVRDNQLLGLGLVVGLNGTGDGPGSQANVEMVGNMLQRLGIDVDNRYMRSRNVAAVVVTATLPGFARSGDTIDATVASLGDARSLQGGVLLQTPLQGADGAVYAVAQGPLIVGGQSSARGPAPRTQSPVATLPAGAIVEKEVPTTFVHGDEILLVLHRPDFATASRVAQAVNESVGSQVAQAVDRGAVAVQVPEEYQENPVEFIAALEGISVTPDAPARVVINERTGTVIIGAGVRVAPVAVTHGTLSLKIEAPSQMRGYFDQESGEQSVVLEGTTVHDVVGALNAIGATPKDVISMLQAIRAAGALYGELVVI